MSDAIQYESVDEGRMYCHSDLAWSEWQPTLDGAGTYERRCPVYAPDLSDRCSWGEGHTDPHHSRRLGRAWVDATTTTTKETACPPTPSPA